MVSPLERYRSLVDDWPAFLDSLSRPLPTCVWAHPGRIDPAGLVALLAGERVASTPIRWRPGAFRIEAPAGFGNRWWYLAGLCHAQEEASMLPVALLGARPGHRVLDLCAAPGGKTAQIAFALGNTGTVVANDPSAGRLRALRANVARLGLVNVSVTCANGANFPRAAGYYDRVLVDVPCSGEGTLRRRAQPGRAGGVGRWRKFRGAQEALLRKAVRLCRPGGRVVYSTCTFAPEENEGVVDAVLRDGGSFGLRVLPVAAPGLSPTPGIDRWEGVDYHPSLRDTLRIWPHHHDTGGFFVAVLEKQRDPVDRQAESRSLSALPRDAWPAGVVERFGIDEDLWSRYAVHLRTGRGLHITARDHRSPAAPEPRSVGLSFIRTGTRFPKLSTAAALLFGRHATANVVDLDGARLDGFLRRERVTPAPGQATGCSGTGYVIVTHRGHPVGTGVLDADAGRLESLYPKRWGGGS